MATRKLADVQQEYKEAVVGLCCICSKPVPGFYGRWDNGGTCSRPCEVLREAQPKFPGHEEDLDDFSTNQE